MTALNLVIRASEVPLPAGPDRVKSSLEHSGKHVLRLLRLSGDQASELRTPPIEIY